ncbi:hypothetical protein HPC49_29245 [Pyxidicoccus fallax]|uniref:Transporter n=1 Tax=Pyxidicoccus fallax TaxID=394095 RepID=A0A848LUQ8_9BACT|nr:hypothetical protein [Pyxidicoccus fallax]NMO21213.1 hypothetical protein [Pyxidicoccus fallax]NPC82292.1 hypothetical protein [Pyxidicoccus fallax]
MKTSSRIRAAWLLATCLALASTAATAQVREPDNFLGTTLVFSSAPRLNNVSTRHFSPTLSAGFKVSDHGQLRLDWGLPYTSMGSGEWSHVGPSNLLLGLHHVSTAVNDTLFLRVGAAVAVPIAMRDDSLQDAEPGVEGANYAAATAVRGLADPWLWALDTTSVVLPLAAGVDLPGFQLRGDVALGMLVPLSRASEDTHFVAQASAEASLGLGLLEPGVRAQVVSPHLTEARWDGNDSQLSLEPFVRARLGAASFRAGVRVDLGRPEDGPRPGAHRMWAFSAGVLLGL